MNKCDFYHLEPERRYFIDKNGVPIYENINIPRCWGTKEKDACGCNGDKSECSFYESVRAKAVEDKNSLATKGVFEEIKDLIGKYWGEQTPFIILTLKTGKKLAQRNYVVKFSS